MGGFRKTAEQCFETADESLLSRDSLCIALMSEATQQEKQTVQGYHGQLLSWRWESLHLTLRHYVHVRPVLQKYLNPDILSSETGFGDQLSALLSDPWHQGY